MVADRFSLCVHQGFSFRLSSFYLHLGNSAITISFFFFLRNNLDPPALDLIFDLPVPGKSVCHLACVIVILLCPRNSPEEGKGRKDDCFATYRHSAELALHVPRFFFFFFFPHDTAKHLPKFRHFHFCNKHCLIFARLWLTNLDRFPAGSDEARGVGVGRDTRDVAAAGGLLRAEPVARLAVVRDVARDAGVQQHPPRVALHRPPLQGLLLRRHPLLRLPPLLVLAPEARQGVARGGRRHRRGRGGAAAQGLRRRLLALGLGPRVRRRLPRRLGRCSELRAWCHCQGEIPYFSPTSSSRFTHTDSSTVYQLCRA
jgi:hypothetical protein